MTHMVLAEQVTHMAAGLTQHSGNGLKNLVLPILGTLLVIVIAVRAFAAFAEERYGKMIMVVLAAMIVAGFVWFPDQGISVVKGLWRAFIGGGQA